MFPIRAQMTALPCVTWIFWIVYTSQLKSGRWVKGSCMTCSQKHTIMHLYQLPGNKSLQLYVKTLLAWDTCIRQRFFFSLVEEHPQWSTWDATCGAVNRRASSLGCKLFLLFLTVHWHCCSCCNVEKGRRILEHFKWGNLYWFPALGISSRGLLSQKNMKRQQWRAR